MSDLRERVLRSVAATPAPTRPAQRRQALRVAAVFVLTLVVAAAFGHRGDRTNAYLTIALLGNVLAVAASTWWLAAPGGALGRGRPLVRLSVASAVTFLVMGVLLAARIAPPPLGENVHRACWGADVAVWCRLCFLSPWGRMGVKSQPGFFCSSFPLSRE